jgi:hypothetical protein
MSVRTCVEIVRVHGPLWVLGPCDSQFETANYLSECATGVGVLVISACSKVQLKSLLSECDINE